MALDNAVLPEESLEHASADARRNSPQTQTQTWAEHHRHHELHHSNHSSTTQLTDELGTATRVLSPQQHASSSSGRSKGSLRKLLHQVTKLFLPTSGATDSGESPKGPAHYRRGSILMRHLEANQATGNATEKDTKFFETIKTHFDANIMETRTVISLSVFQTGSNPMNDPFAVVHMPTIIQQGFRRKLFALFALQLLAVVLLLCMWNYVPPIVAAIEPVFSQWHYTFAAFVAMVAALLWLYVVKYTFPLNFVVLSVYTVTQSLFFAACDVLFATKSSIFIFSFLLCIMALTTVLCTVVVVKRGGGASTTSSSAVMTTLSKTVTSDESAALSPLPLPSSSTSVPVLISYPIVIIIGYSVALLGSLVIYFCYMQDVVSALQFVGSLTAMLLLVLWFAYDASCMNERLAPDEYMQGMVFFYTDMVLFLLFLSIIFVACFACEGDCACYGTADIAPIGVSGRGDDEEEEDEMESEGVGEEGNGSENSGENDDDDRHETREAVDSGQ